MATHSSILAWRIPGTEEPGGFRPWGHKELDTTERLSTHAHLSPALDRAVCCESPLTIRAALSAAPGTGGEVPVASPCSQS